MCSTAGVQRVRDWPLPISLRRLGIMVRFYTVMDFTIVVWWKSIIKAIIPEVIDSDLPKPIHLSIASTCFLAGIL